MMKLGIYLNSQHRERDDPARRLAEMLAQARLIRALERLSSAHRRRLAQSLEALTSAMEVADSEPAMFFSGEERRAPRRSRHA
jgi:hypothetical protein